MQVSVEVNGILAVAEVKSFTPSSPGQLSGPPERCYPPDPAEVELGRVLIMLPNEGGIPVAVDIASEYAFEEFVAKVEDAVIEKLDQ